MRLHFARKDSKNNATDSSAEVERITAARAGDIRMIKELVIDPNAEHLAEKILIRLLKFVWFLPASEGHHHSSEFGLFDHSLKTSIKVLEKFDQEIHFEFRENSGDIDSHETRKKRPRIQYGAFLTGLLHDVGKIVQFSLTAKNGEIWSHNEPLHDFAMRHGVRFSDVIYNKYNNVYALHQKIAPFYASILISEDDYNYLHPGILSDVINAVSYKPSTDNRYKDMLSTSDGEGTKENIETAPTRKDLLGEIIQYLKEIFSTGRVVINSAGGRAWVFKNFTAITIALLNETRTSVAAKSGGKPVENAVVLKLLVDRNYVDKEDWKCIYRMEFPTMGKNIEYKVVKFRNNILWGDSTPEICKMDATFTIT